MLSTDRGGSAALVKLGCRIGRNGNGSGVQRAISWPAELAPAKTKGENCADQQLRDASFVGRKLTGWGGVLAVGLFLTFFSLVGPVSAGNAGNSRSGGGGKPSSATSVTSILNDTGVVANGTNYRVQSDNVSTDYFNGVSGVSSVLQASLGDWVLDTSVDHTGGADRSPGSSSG